MLEKQAIPASTAGVYTNGQTPDTKVTVRGLTGPELQAWVRRAGATCRACIAQALRDGSLRVSGLTAEQARALAKVNGSYVSAVHKLPPEQRARLERGSLGLAEVVRRGRNGNGASA
jgi:hypothetical protein